jgi:hypothetical protein
VNLACSRHASVILREGTDAERPIRSGLERLGAGR